MNLYSDEYVTDKSILGAERDEMEFFKRCLSAVKTDHIPVACTSRFYST